jgi:hypothetical protein
MPVPAEGTSYRSCRYAHLAPDDVRNQWAMKRCWLSGTPWSGLNSGPVVTPEGLARSADRAQARQSASYQSAHPYPQSHQPRQ